MNPALLVVAALGVCGCVLCLWLGVWLGTLKSSSKLTAADSTLKAAAAVSRLASQTATRASLDWNLAQRMESTLKSVTETSALVKEMDLLLLKLVDSLPPPSRRRPQSDPVERFIGRTRSDLPGVATYSPPPPETPENEAGIARPQASAARD